MRAFSERLARGPMIVGDGAWGSLLIERGLGPGECPERWNVARPEVIVEIAEAYLDAGAELLTSNTFGGSPVNLRTHALEGEAGVLNRRGVELLRSLAGGRAWVSASIGPTGAILEPYGDTPEDVVYEAFQRQIEALAEGGADLLCVETMTDLREASLAIRAARNVAPELPRIATMTFDATPRGFFTIMGVDVARAVAGLAGAGADVVGSNCGNGSDAMLEIAREIVALAPVPVAIRPNAGLPERRAGALVYPESPAAMAERAPRFVELGVRLLGGCCGTTPDHVRALRGAVPSPAP